MKIFNWVHRKLRCGNNIDPSATYEGIDELYHDQPSKAMTDNVIADKQALLGQGALVEEVLGGWNNTILTIGTLGSFDDSLNFSNFNYDEIEEVFQKQGDNHEERNDNDEEEDENYPLVVRSFGGNLKHGIEMNGFQTNRTEKNDGKKNGERTTLADLFSADYDYDYDNDIDNDNDFGSDTSDRSSEVLPKFKALGHVHVKKHALGGAKIGKSFAKKLIPLVGDDSRPIKKLNQLMTRMLKRKIHPVFVFDGKIPKSDGQCGILINVELEANESASLLQI